MIFLYISNLIVVTIFLTFGRFINLLIFKDLTNKKNIIYDIFSGIIYLSFIALFFNFFLPLDRTLNNFFLVISIFILIKIYFHEKKYILEYIKIIFLIGSVSFLIMVLTYSYNPDAGLYHLPYISILNDYKILIGLSNIHFRFGHTSIIQYTSAIFNNSLFLTKGITIPISTVLCSVFVYFFGQTLKNKNNYFFFIFFFLVTIFIILKNNRYNDIGNDIIGHLFYFVVLSIFLRQIYYNKKEYINFFYLSLFCIFAFANKVFLVVSFLFPFFFIIYFKKYKYLINLKNLILILFLLSIFIKNILISSCVIYPVKNLCFENFSWSANKENMHGSYERRGLESEVAAKSWADLKDKSISREYYNKNFNWLSTWLDKHFKYLTIKLLPLIFIIILIFILLFKIERIDFFDNKKKINNLINKIFIISFSVNLLGLILWFLKFPLYRYGYSFIVIAIILITSFSIHIFFSNKKILKILRISKIIILVSLVFISLINIKRIFKEFNIEYNDYPWPKIYAYDKNNFKQDNVEILVTENFSIYNPKYRLCMYSKGPCTHFDDVNNQIEVNKKYNYKIIIPKNFN